MLYDGSAIAAGRAVALVVAVGRDTEAGRSAAAAADPPPSGVEQRLAALTRLTVPVTLAGGAIVTGLGFLYRRPARAAVGAGVALTVAAIPEGLPTLATITQIAAARRLASRNALVRNPRALEALGRVDQVCFDKTGTLTQGSISLACVSDGEHDEQLDALGDRGRFVLAAALRATPLLEGDDVLPHATDQAIVVGAAVAGVGTAHGRGAWERIDEIPFESRRGYHAVLGNDHRGTPLDHAEGRARSRPSPGRQLATGRTGPSRSTPRRVARSKTMSNSSAGAGYACWPWPRRRRPTAPSSATARRSPASSSSASSASPISCGRTAAAAVRDLAAAGVRLTMITGDHPSTAEAIASELGLLDTGRVLTGADLDLLADDELRRRAARRHRLRPRHARSTRSASSRPTNAPAAPSR